jgi:hypothetical protein
MKMRGRSAAWARIMALCSGVTFAFALTVAPVTLAVTHGPGAMAAEADHRAYHAEHGHSHEIAGPDHHDPSDHDHVGAALFASPDADVPPPPERTLRPEVLAADGMIRDGPRRPPRLTMI